MNIYLHELKSYRKSLIVWNVVIVCVLVTFVAVYPSMYKDMQQYMELLSTYPQQFFDALGISLDSIFDILGFYSFIFLFIALCGAIQASNLGVSIISKEVRARTADFLITRPCTRKTIMSAKILSSVTAIIITNVVLFISAYGCVEMFKNNAVDYKLFAIMTASHLFIQIVFFAIGVLVSTIFQKMRSVLPVSLGIVFMAFIINMIANASSDSLKFITPFSYFNPTYVYENGHYETSLVFVAAVVTIASIALSYFIYIKKDIHAV